MKQRTYIAIDLKSFYASVECRERNLDPLDTNLVVADESRTDKTICLAVTPSLKSYGISGRGRLFEVKQRVKEANAGRQHDAPGRKLEGSSYLFSELQENPSLAIDFIIAPPRMAYYMEYSTRIYQVYMKYVAPEDIIVYSIDEVFMDVTDYLATYKLSPHDLAMKIILDVLSTAGITATAGIGTNLYLCKVAMDIVAKHIPADKNGVRIAELDEMSYRKTLWSHQPLTDFWRVGKGYAKKLEENGMFTMGDVARRSVTDEDLLYKLFGKNAELLIDHAWGWEPCTVEAVKAYKPESNSLGSGQVLHQPYEADKARLVLREMADLLSMDLVDKGFVTNQLVVTIDKLLIPNARRDNFEKNPAYFALFEQLMTLAAEITRDIRAASLKRNSLLSNAISQLNETAQQAASAIDQGVSGVQKGLITKKLKEAHAAVSNSTINGDSEQYYQDIAFAELDMLIGKLKGTTKYKALNTIDSLTNTEKKILERVINIVEALDIENSDAVIEAILNNFSAQ